MPGLLGRSENGIHRESSMNVLLVGERLEFDLLDVGHSDDVDWMK